MPLVTQTHVIEPTGGEYDSRNPSGATSFDITVGPVGFDYDSLYDALDAATAGQSIGVFGGSVVQLTYDDPAYITGNGGNAYTVETQDLTIEGFGGFQPKLVESTEALKGILVIATVANPTIRCTLKNLEFADRRSSTPASYYLDGIRPQQLAEVTVENCTFKNNDNGCLDGGRLISFTDCTFDGNGIDQFTHDAYISNATCEQSQFIRCTFSNGGVATGQSSHSVQDRGQNCFINQCTFNAGDQARHINKLGGGMLTVTNCNLTDDALAGGNNTSAIIRFDGTTGSCLISGNTITRLNGDVGTALDNSGTITAQQTGNTFSGFVNETSGTWNGSTIPVISGEWVELPNTAGFATQDDMVASFIPPYTSSHSNGCRKSWNGGTWNYLDFKSHTYLNGGHNNSPFNFLDEYDPLTGGYSLVEPPSSTYPSGDNFQTYPDGRASSRHTYGNTVFTDQKGTQGRVYTCGGSVWENSSTTAALWEYDLATNTETRLDDAPDGSFASGAMCEIPGGLFLTKNSGGTYAAKYSFTTNSWEYSVRKDGVAFSAYWHQAYCSGTDEVLLVGNGNIEVFNPNTGDLIPTSWTNNTGVAVENDKAPGVMKHPTDVNKLLVVGPQVSSDIFIFDMPTRVVTRRIMTGVDITSAEWTYTTGGDAYNGVYGRVHTCRGLEDDVILYHGRSGKPCLAGRL